LHGFDSKYFNENSARFPFWYQALDGEDK
jgi:hypothetical protein